MDKIEIEFKPFEGEKLAVLNKDVLENLSQYLQLEDRMKAKRHILVVFVNNEEEERAVDAFTKNELNGIVIVIKRVLRRK